MSGKKFKIRPIRIETDFAYILLTKGYEAKIDLCDIERVRDYNWCRSIAKYTQYACRVFYSKINNKWVGKNIYLHRFILDVEDDNLEVDHRDHNGLNCIRNNLRISTRNQNQQNQRGSLKHGYKGISFDKKAKKNPWEAHIEINKVGFYLGRYSDPILAAKAYDNAALKYFGEFACTNKSMGLFDEKN